MIILAPSEQNSCSNPKIVFFAQQEGKLVDLDSLKFQVFKVDETGDLTSVVAETTLTLTDCPAGTKLGTGRYVAPFTASDNSNLGEHVIRWTWTWTAGGFEHSADQHFEVALSSSNQPVYSSVSALRDECSSKSSRNLHMSLVVASRLVERYTGMRFGANYGAMKFDGANARALLFSEPVIALESLEFQGSFSSATTIDLDSVRVYNRHLSGLVQPDDRDDPKIEFIHESSIYGVSTGNSQEPVYEGYDGYLKFPYGVQNVSITGIFGYTDRDGTPWGKVPDLISYVTRRIALQKFPNLAGDEGSCAASIANEWRIVSEKTKDQSVTYAQPRKFGEYTGDPDIDQILLMYRRPPSLGSV